ncbi:MAG: hypothetical protein R3E91_00360 [Chlamydiales bacterium]
MSSEYLSNQLFQYQRPKLQPLPYSHQRQKSHSQKKTYFTYLSKWRVYLSGLFFIASKVSLIWSVFVNNYPFIVFFGLSSISSCYMIYISYKFQHLKKFETNNIELQQSIKKIQKSETHLKNEVVAMKHNNGQMKQSILTFKSLLEKTTQDNKEYETLIERMSSEITNLKNMKSNIESMIHDFQSANKSLLSTSQATNKSYEVFEKHLACFEKHLVDLNTEKNQLQGEVTNLFNSWKISMYTVKNLFDDIKELKFSECSKHLMSLIATLKEEKCSLLLEVAKLEGQLKINDENMTLQKETLKKITDEVKGLEEIKNQISIQLRSITEEFSDFKEDNGRFNKLVEKMSKLSKDFKKYHRIQQKI